MRRGLAVRNGEQCSLSFLGMNCSGKSLLALGHTTAPTVASADIHMLHTHTHTSHTLVLAVSASCLAFASAVEMACFSSDESKCSPPATARFASTFFGFIFALSTRRHRKHA